MMEGHSSNNINNSQGHHGNPISSISGDRLGAAVTGVGGVAGTTSYRQINNSSPSSDSSSETSSSEESSSSNDDNSILRRAGVTFDLSTISSSDGHAPLELVSQCVSCMMTNHHAAANLLCQKVLELEPGNKTAKEMLPVLQERLTLNKELPTESSSSSSEEEEGESSSSSSDGD